MVISGRSDAVLNPAGVRIGTSEIYRQAGPQQAPSEAIEAWMPAEQDGGFHRASPYQGGFRGRISWCDGVWARTAVRGAGTGVDRVRWKDSRSPLVLEHACVTGVALHDMEAASTLAGLCRAGRAVRSSLIRI